MVDDVAAVFLLAVALGRPPCVKLMVAVVYSGATYLGISCSRASMVAMLPASLPIAGSFIFTIVVVGSAALVV
jgi:hypothetical protein